MGSVVSILMKVFPKYVMTIASFTETLFGLGYMIGIWNADVVHIFLNQALTTFPFVRLGVTEKKNVYHHFKNRNKIKEVFNIVHRF